MLQPASSGMTDVGLRQLADCGPSSEVIDGETFETFAGTLAHQRAVGKLFALMRWACTDDASASGARSPSSSTPPIS